MLISSVGILGESEGRNDFPGDEMFLDDAFQDCGRTRVIPDAFGIDHGDGAADADPETISLGAEDQWRGADKVEFFQSALQELPGRQTFCLGTAFGLGWGGAQEDVALELFQAQLLRHGFQILRHVWFR